MYLSLLRTAVFAALIYVPAATAAIGCNDACQRLLDEGNVLRSQGKLGDAWNTYRRAREADPSSSFPVSSMANVLTIAADQSPADKAPAMRQQAAALARDALKLNAYDPLAQETLRQLEDEKPAPLHEPTPEAAQVAQEGEALFAQHRYQEALEKYELAARRDPLYSNAWVYAGDCYFSLQQWHEAELRFRKATEIEPLNGQAWRFLSDSLILQGDRKAGESALYSGIAAQPSQKPNWDKLEFVLKRDGMALKRLGLVRRARFTGLDKDGKTSIAIVEQEKGKEPDQAFWMLHALASAGVPQGAPDTPYQRELQAWRISLAMLAGKRAQGEPVPNDPALVAIEKLKDAGQLEPAILLLMYRESYRPEFEAWKKAHPDGIRAFVVSTGLRP